MTYFQDGISNNYVASQAVSYFQPSGITGSVTGATGYAGMNGSYSVQSMLHAAEAYMQLQDYEDAEKIYQEIVLVEPQNYNVWIGYSRAYSRNYTRKLENKSQFETMIRCYNSVLAFAPDDQKILFYNEWSPFYNQQLENFYRQWGELSENAGKSKAEEDKLRTEAEDAEKESEYLFHKSRNVAPAAKPGSRFKFRHAKRVFIVTILWLILIGLIHEAFTALKQQKRVSAREGETYYSYYARQDEFVNTADERMERYRRSEIMAYCVVSGFEIFVILLAIIKGVRFRKLNRLGAVYKEEAERLRKQQSMVRSSREGYEMLLARMSS